MNPDQTVTYTPNPAFVGTDSFTYTITDGNGGQAGATVTVVVSSDHPVLFVESIAMGLISAGVNWKATANVRVLDQSGQPASGAAVEGSWYYNGSLVQTGVLATTDSAGTASFVSSPEKASSQDVFTFEVTGVSLEGHAYEPTLNQVSQESISPPY